MCKCACVFFNTQLFLLYDSLCFPNGLYIPTTKYIRQAFEMLHCKQPHTHRPQEATQKSSTFYEHNNSTRPTNWNNELVMATRKKELLCRKKKNRFRFYAHEQSQWYTWHVCVCLWWWYFSFILFCFAVCTRVHFSFIWLLIVVATRIQIRGWNAMYDVVSHTKYIHSRIYDDKKKPYQHRM